MEIKKTTKYDGKLKNLSIINNQIFNEDGEIIDLIQYLSKAYGDKFFDLSTTTKVEELIDIELDCEEDE